MYYNNVIVIFSLDSTKETIDYRTATQMLPSGAIPAVVLNFNNGTYYEIQNDFTKDEIFSSFKNDDFDFNSINFFLES